MLIRGLGTTIIGLSVVFLTLAILAFLIGLMKYFKTEEKKLPDTLPTVPEKPKDPEPEMIPEQDETELIAVIAAAVAASMGTTTDKLRIVSLRRSEKSAWNHQARREQQRQIY